MSNIAVKDEAHWLTLRDQHIGGSDVAALFNVWLLPNRETVTLHAYEAVPDGALPLGSCSPYSNAYKLFMTKSGQMMPEDWNPSERMQAGTYLEPALAEWSQAKWDWKLRKVRRYHSHDEVPGWGASVDFEVHGPGMDPVEFKNVDFLIARDQWVIEGEEVIAAPLHIMLQLQHYIGARGASQGWIVVCVGGNTLARGCFKTHAPTIERIRDAISAFWTAVERGIAPLHVAEFDTVKEQFAAGGGTAPRDLTGNETATTLAQRYLRWKKHLDFTEGVIGNLKGQLGALVGDTTKALGDGFKVSWPVIEREEKTIPERVQKAMTYRGAFTVTKTK